MKKAYVELEMENLESLSKVGGFDNDMGSTTE